MRKKKTIPKKVLAERLSWQTGDYSRSGTYQFIVPYEFLLLCKLMRVTPKTLLKDFMESVTASAHNEHAEYCRSHTVAFMKMKYGSRYFTEEQLRLMFIELERSIMPDLRNADDALLDAYELWKEQFLHHWFRKWNNISAGQIPLNSPT